MASARSVTPGGVLDLVQQAASILAREVAVNPRDAFGMPSAPKMDLPLRSAGSGIDVDRLRRYAHEVIETLLASSSVARPPAEDRIPWLRGTAPVQAGLEACVSLRIANEEATASEVSLYCTDFVADGGFEIPALRVSFSPRMATLAPNSEASFEIKVAVPPQAPPGIYSGLVQASGAKYVKAVVSVEVK
ncbi:MAG: hypothetical protein M3O36_05010 [Myxococcota bacterium]|nr:hypothetical protein [Myxococcota bacterium]